MHASPRFFALPPPQSTIGCGLPPLSTSLLQYSADNMSSSASSIISSDSGIMPAKLRNLGQKPRPEIKIKLNGETCGLKSYSTLDRIEGTVAITASHDSVIENLEIEFIGTSKTFVERLTSSTAVAGRTEAFHQFLKLSQPISQSSLPQSRILSAGQTLELPFLFVVPEQSLDRICRHVVEHATVRDEHLQLPPSLGDQGVQDSTPDDLSPDMASIRYAVTAKLVETEQNIGKTRSIVKAKKVRIVPARDELPPVNVDGANNDYIMRTEKSLRKGVFKGKLGTLVTEVAQPKSLRLSAPNATSPTPVSTMATVMLRFEPADERSQPPRLGSLSSKLKVNTFYGSSARQNIPSKKSMQWDLHQGLHSEAISLPSRCVAGVEWTHHSREESELLDRRDSAFSTSSLENHRTPLPSAKYQGNGFYTARILVPITLPGNKNFVPTFHSCLISRTYSITLSLGIHSVGLGPNVELKVPVQISSAANADSRAQHRASLTAEEAVIEARDADDFFQTRTLSPAPEDVVGRSILPNVSQELPPEYSAFSRPTASVPVHG